MGVAGCLVCWFTNLRVMSQLDKSLIATSARSLKLAERCIRKTLKACNDSHAELITTQRTAELEATCVILMRAHAELWAKYDLSLLIVG